MKPRMLDVRRSIALTTALVVTAFGASAVPAFSLDQGKGNGNGQSHSAGKNADKKADKGKKGQGGKSNSAGSKSNAGASNAGGNGNGNGPGTNNAGGNGNGGGPGTNNAGGNGGGNGNGGSGDKGGKGGNGDPAGNNGTVKITPIGQDDGIPQNNPHVPCGFDIEWYGFDEGADIVSQVSLVPHAPTADAVMELGGPSEVFVGGDPASGAGTDSGFDGEATYYPTFTGTPHPKQGYHVKLTIHTPGSQGADVKHKVFWIEPCEEGTTVPGEEETPTDTEGETEETEGPTDEETTSPEVEGTQEETDDDEGDSEITTQVAGTQAAAGADGVMGTSDDVPTAVDAGESGNPVLDMVTSPMGAILLLAGLATLGAAFIARRQARL